MTSLSEPQPRNDVSVALNMASDSEMHIDDCIDYVSGDISNELVESARKGKGVPEANELSIGPASQLSTVKIMSSKV